MSGKYVDTGSSCSAECHECTWSSIVGIRYSEAVRVSTTHVAISHPDTYMRVTHSDVVPVPSDLDLWELELYTWKEGR